MSINAESITARINAAMRQSRDISELIGVCKGVLADGTVNLQEAIFVLQWLESHDECLTTWPASELHSTLDSFLEDGILSPQEESQLLETLVGITGTAVTLKQPEKPAAPANTSSTLPLFEPPEGIIFTDRNFVLTGTFEMGTRPSCERLIIEKGGKTQKAPTKSTHYLVVGNIGSKDWAHSSFGRKIQKAAEMRRSGVEIYIISEATLSESL